MASAPKRDLTPDEFAEAVGADPGSMRENSSPLADLILRGARLYSYKRDGQEYILGFRGGDLWMWGRHPQDSRAPLLAASSLRLMAQYMEVMEKRVASGVEKFMNSSEDVLRAIREGLGNPDNVREMFGEPDDADEIMICAAGVARLTAERLLEARAAREKREKMH